MRDGLAWLRTIGSITAIISAACGDNLSGSQGDMSADGGSDAGSKCVPKGAELCNGIDDDCDGVADEECPLRLDWAIRGGGSTFDQAAAVAVLPDGSTFVTGVFTGTATFGDGASSRTVTSAGGTDVFVANYDATHTLVWLTRAGGPG